MLTAILVFLVVYQAQKNNQKHRSEADTASVSENVRALRIIPQSEVDAVNEAQRAELERQKAFARKIETDKDFAESELQRLIADNPRAKRTYQIVKAATLPISFYGKIIDSENKPISNVQIKYSIGSAYGMGQPVHGMAKTDDKGLYVIRGEGAILSLHSFVESGYQFPDSRQHFFSATESGRPNTWRDHTATNPYITVGIPR